MFAAIRLTLRNALAHAKTIMRFTQENYDALVAVVSLLSENRYLLLGIGEDVDTRSAEVALDGDRLKVDAGSATPGVVTYLTATYDFDVLLKHVVLEGERVSFEVTKRYEDATTFAAGPGQLPLKSDNFTLKVTIQPGGHLKRAALLQEIVME